MKPQAMLNQVQLITYVDRLGGDIAGLGALLRGPLRGLFGGVHLLPFFTPIDGADAGFDPVDHASVDARLGDWRDIAALASDTQVIADLIVNHISRSSTQFQDFQRRGKASPWAPLFLTRDSVFGTDTSDAAVNVIYRPRPGAPFTPVMLDTGDTVQLWTTFTPEQVDIDVMHPLGQQYLGNILRTFAANGIKMVRLDAVGYAIKQAGTRCFMLPATFDFIRALSAQVNELGMEVLVEIHSHYRKQVEIARLVDWVYDFALPPLLLHAFEFKTARPLQHWLQVRPHNALTVLDTHDGIGVIDIGGDGEEPGLVPPAELDELVERIHRNSRGQSRAATGAAASNLDLYQVNCTYYDALGRDDRRYLMARAVQFFVPGIPQIYYVGLLAGENDMRLLQKSGVGRDINRHYYTAAEVEAALERPVVAALCALIRLRNTHSAFQGKFSLASCTNYALTLRWDNGNEFAELHVDFASDTWLLRHSDDTRIDQSDPACTQEKAR
jgi:sucrose phosphorylase